MKTLHIGDYFLIGASLPMVYLLALTLVGCTWGAIRQRRQERNR